jgi:hypothetical protein
VANTVGFIGAAYDIPSGLYLAPIPARNRAWPQLWRAPANSLPAAEASLSGSG